MDIGQYKAAVIALFKNGATDEQWGELASVVLHASENDATVDAIDAAIHGKCEVCGDILYEGACEHGNLIDSASKGK